MAMRQSLIPKSEFTGLDGPDAPAHLATGGEVPVLKRHLAAVERFASDKSGGMEGRERLFATYRRCKERLGTLFGVSAEDIAVLPSSSHAVQLARYGLDWRPGDNVVVADVEYPSLIYPWPALAEHGVELRIVRRVPGSWEVPVEALARQVDGRTRALFVSQVSYLTGQRYDLAALARVAASGGGEAGRPRALLCVDATHAAGVVPVEARHADILWSSCYKWLLGTHGVGVCYLNPAVWGGIAPPFPGAHSADSSRDLDQPEVFHPAPGAAGFETGNPNFIGLYVLDSALEVLLGIGAERIAAHATALSGRVRQGVADLGFEVMTPGGDGQRAGNTCFAVPEPEAARRTLAQQGVVVWAGDGRIRISTHLFNDDADVDRLLAALPAVRGAGVAARG